MPYELTPAPLARAHKDALIALFLFDDILSANIQGFMQFRICRRQCCYLNLMLMLI